MLLWECQHFLTQQMPVKTINYSCCCSRVLVAIISFTRLHRMVITGTVLQYCAGMGVLIVEHMFSQIHSIYTGVHGPLFVATNVDRSDCVHIAIRTLQR